jgi:Xaa-Pro aminopeptidase
MTRADRLAELAAGRDLDAVLVVEPFNLRYLTGFTGTNGLAVVGAGGGGVRRFVTDFRYVEQADDEVDGFDCLRGERDLLDSVGAAMGDAGSTVRLGYDDANTSVRTHRRLGELLGDRVELVSAGGLVEELRAVKDEVERRAIAEAAALADEALIAALERGLAGRSERAFALDLEDEIRHRGAAAPSFPSIVAAGAHAALPHAEPRDVEVAGGCLVIVDWGAQVDGYCSDCTRTLATGPVDGEATQVYALVLEAQLAGLDALAPGRTGREVDGVARELIDAAGHGEHFGHGLGHGVGLEVHEDPRLSKAGDETLAAGNVVTVEPGVYLPGHLGVRIEDLVVVTDNGAKVLSSHPKELVTVG